MNSPFDNSNDTDRDLDELLQQAAWPEPSPEQEARLLATWDRLSNEELTLPTRRSVYVWTLVGALTTVAAIVAVAFLIRLTGGIELRDGSQRPVYPGIVFRPMPPIPPTEESSPNKPVYSAEQIERYDTALIHVYTRRLKGARVDAVLTAGLEKLASQPDVGIHTIIDEWTLAQRKQIAKQLAKRFERIPEEHQTAAAAILAEIGTRESLPRLRVLEADERFRAIARLGIVRLAPSNEVYRCLTTLDSREMQTAAVKTLLSRDDNTGPAMVVRLVNEGHGEIVEAAARDNTNPAYHTYVRMLGAPRPATRQVATRVLAAFPSSEVSQALIEQVRFNRSRSQALMILTMRQDPVAIAFLQHAARNRKLAASLHSARRRQAATP